VVAPPSTADLILRTALGSPAAGLVERATRSPETEVSLSSWTALLSFLVIGDPPVAAGAGVKGTPLAAVPATAELIPLAALSSPAAGLAANPVADMSLSLGAALFWSLEVIDAITARRLRLMVMAVPATAVLIFLAALRGSAALVLVAAVCAAAADLRGVAHVLKTGAWDGGAAAS
jgi:hypothetical protein